MAPAIGTAMKSVNLIGILRGIENGETGFSDTKLDRHLDDAAAAVLKSRQARKRRQGSPAGVKSRGVRQERGSRSPGQCFKKQKSGPPPQQQPFALSWSKRDIAAGEQQHVPISTKRTPGATRSMNALSLIEDTNKSASVHPSTAIHQIKNTSLPMLTYDSIANASSDLHFMSLQLRK